MDWTVGVVDTFDGRTTLVNWLRRILGGNDFPANGTVQKEGVQRLGDESNLIPEADDASIERINRNLQTDVYGPVREKDVD